MHLVIVNYDMCKPRNFAVTIVVVSEKFSELPFCRYDL